MMKVQEAKRIERTVEAAVVKAVRSNLKEVVHLAVHKALGDELNKSKGSRLPKDKPPPKKSGSKPSLKRTASRLLEREVRNGVLSPMPGGRCELVWLALDDLHKKGHSDLQHLKEVSDRKKWNWNNSRTEYYRWKKFHDLPL